LRLYATPRGTNMKREELLKLFEQVGAIRTGHFELSSGRHSATYIQCALVLEHPKHAEQLGRALADLFRDHSVSCVVSPALGGVIIGYEVARALGVRSLFVERDRSGQMALRRGFELKPGERVLVIEDVWTTGGSTRETIGVVEQSGGLAIATGALIDRSGGRVELNVPARALLEMEVSSYEPDDCPLCRAGGEPMRPGSRFSRTAP
ncbi:MAG: orotate phosphoribosyltransferase, partial [Candidatus Acidiferrales bacterium]